MAKLADLFIKLGLKKDGFDKGIDQAKSKTNAFGSAVKKIGGLMAGAFAVDRIISFGREFLELGGIAEGVRAAFNRIADDSVLMDLQNATKGTVSQLELMKRTVMASNFQIPVENLASLFAFATKRAQETGESVDYLVNSIVLGIGRKSPLILDNLGISAVRLRQELKGAGVELNTVQDIAAAVGRIAAEEMEKSGDIIETNAIKIQNLKASWEDFKLTLATDPSVHTFMGRIIREAQDFINLTTKFQTTKQVEKQRKAEEEAARARKERAQAQIEIHNMFGKSIRDMTDEEVRAAVESSKAANDAFDAKQKLGKTIGELKEETDALKNSLDDYGVTQKQEIQNTLKQIEDNEKLIKSLTTLSVAREDISMSTMQGITPDYASIFASPELDTSVLASMDSFREMIKERYNKLISEASEFGMMMQDALKSGVANAIAGLSEAIGEAFGSGNWDGFGEAVLKVIGGFMQQLGALMIAYAVNMGLFAAAATNPLSWPVALAAGVAMVAAGAAISSLASKGLGGTSPGASASGYSPGGSSASTAISGNVNFVLEGDKLVGAINNNSSKRRLTR